MLETEASKQSLGKQVFWLTARNGPEPPSRTTPMEFAQWHHRVREPGRSQRRPRTGFAPVSLFVSGLLTITRKHLSSEIGLAVGSASVQIFS